MGISGTSRRKGEADAGNQLGNSNYGTLELMLRFPR
jgi:hypothetical protein